MKNKKEQPGFSLGISLSKPHIPWYGQLAWWLEMHEVYIRTQDYQCWYIIENGDYEISEKDKLSGMRKSLDRKSTRLNSSHITRSRMPSSA